MNIKEGLAYSDVLIVPQFSDIVSRKEVDLRTTLFGYNVNSPEFSLPIIASPMDTITEKDMALAVNRAGALAIIHRYNSIEEQAAIVDSIRTDCNLIAAAIGTGEEGLTRALALCEAGVRILCIDTAHGDHILMQKMLHNLRREVGGYIHIMAGNVATKEGYERLVEWGADSIRCGIGSGAICSTRIQTGHGVPALQTVLDCAESIYDVPIIADGGIRNSGDIVKALAAGASFVMCGSLLSGTDETPGEVTADGRKSYRGMASRDAQMDWRGRAASLEGIATTVPCKGPVTDVLADLERGIRSGLSYSGARTISELQKKAIFVRQTNAGQVESSTHILSK